MNTTPRARLGWRAAAGLLASLALTATALAQAPAKGSAAHISATVNKVNAAFMKNNASKTPDWPSYGLDYAETRHSKLNQISTSNVKELGLVWSYNLESKRGVESTPLVVDGIMYVTASWSVVHAVDVRTGKRSGRSIPRCRARRATRAAATWSTAAWRCTRARCLWRLTTAA